MRSPKTPAEWAWERRIEGGMKITIGTEMESGKAFALPSDLVTSTLIVYGGKGMGKTNLGAVLVEELTRAGLRWSVLDPMGVWWGLRHSRNGKGAGIECLILGGTHGDIPIEPTGGAVVADLVADEQVNVIIDFSRKPNGEAWGVGEKIRFVTAYGRRLFERQSSEVEGKRREPLFQVMDEAARYIPQMIRAGQPDLAMCLSVWAQIVEEGRNSGLGVAMLTQRSARLSKDVAELADAMLAFRTVGPNSINAVMDWLGEHVPRERIKGMIEQLRSLPVGRCMIVSPGFLQFEGIVQVRERETFDSSATPKPGESRRRTTGAPARPDLGKYVQRMQETIQRAAENNPSALRKRITELERQLASGQAKAKSSPAPHEQSATIQTAVFAAAELRDRQWKNALETIVRGFVSDIEEAARDSVNTVLRHGEAMEARRHRDHDLLACIRGLVSSGKFSPKAAGTSTTKEDAVRDGGTAAAPASRLRPSPPPRTANVANGSNHYLPPGEKPARAQDADAEDD